MADKKVRVKYEADIDEVIDSVDRMTDAHADALGEMERQAKESGSRMSDVMKGSFLGSFAGGIATKGFELVSGAIDGIMGAMIGGNAEMETYTIQFATLMGSTEAAKQRLEELAKFGAETPFELPEIARAEKVLLGFGLTGQKVIDMTGKNAEEFRTIVGDIAAGTGQSFEEIALNMGKFSSGATGEAISRFQELGIVTREQLREMGVEFSKSGELLSPLPVAMQAITKITEEKFGGGMAALSSSFGGLTSTMQDVFGEIGRTIGAPLFAQAKEGLVKVLEVLQDPDTQAAIKGIAEGIGDVIEILFDNKEIIATVAAGWAAYTAAQKLATLEIGNFSKMLKTNPYMLLVAGIAAAVMALKDYQESSHEAAQSALKEADAQIELNKRAVDTTKAKQDQLQKNLQLMETYENLGKKVNRTKEEEDQYRESLRELQNQYPGIVSAGATFEENLAAIKTQAEKTKTQIAGLSVEIDKLDKKSKAMVMGRADTAVEAEVEKLLNNIRDKYSATLLGLNITDEKYLAKISSRALNLIQMGQTESEVLDAVVKSEEKLKAVLKGEGIVPSSSEMQEFSSGLDEIAKKQIEYLKLTSKGGIIDPTAGTDPNAGKPDPTAVDDKAAKERERLAREAFAAAMAQLKREEEIAILNAQLVDASEAALEEIRASYRQRRVDTAKQFAQQLVDLEHEIVIATLKLQLDAHKKEQELADAALSAMEERGEQAKEFLEGLQADVDALDIDILPDYEKNEKELREAREDFQREYVDPVSGAMTELVQSFADTRMTGLEREQMFWNSMKNIALDVTGQILEKVIADGLMMLAESAGLVAAQAPIAAAAGATWAGPAALASTATFGGAAVAGAAGLSSTFALAQLMAVPKFLEKGGILNKPTFVAGEAGAEVVGSLTDLIAVFRAAIYGPQQRRTKILNRTQPRVNIGIGNKMFGRGSRSAQISQTSGAF